MKNDDENIQEWKQEWKNFEGQLHREDGPARIFSDGRQEWWKDGELHREDGPAIDYLDTLKEWWVDGERHRIGGPALIYSSAEEWWVNNKLHRLNGPAVVDSDGRQGWHLNGKYLGLDDEGFWALWDLLDEEQREDEILLKFCPGLPK
jgi:hypothetical protein